MVLLLSRAACAEAADVTGLAGGLTAVVDRLVATRPPVELAVGSLTYDIDDFVLNDFAGMFSCDAALSEYLDGDGDLYYERLSEIIEETIRAKFDDGNGTLFALVESSAEGDVILVSIAVEYSRTALLPVYLETAGRELTFSFAMPCSVKFGVLLSVRVDSATVLAQDAGVGCSLSVERLTVGLSSVGDDSASTARVVYRDTLRDLSVVECTLDAVCDWDLTGTRADACESRGACESRDVCESRENGCRGPWLTYGRIARGDYEWLARASGGTRLLLRHADEDDVEFLEVVYESGVLRYDTPDEKPVVAVTDGEESFSLPLYVRGRP